MKLLVLLITVAALCGHNVIASAINHDHNNAEEGEFLVEEPPSAEDFERSIREEISLYLDSNSYLLFTRKNPTAPQTIRGGSVISSWLSNYDSSKPLKVIAHGWTGNARSLVNSLVTSAFLDTADVNVIVVDWGERASGNYAEASVKAVVAGRSVANFLTWLFDTRGGSWDNVHLIGYSLGAHVVGNIGREAGGKAKRVTGLDPAGPFWSNNEYALSTESGQYVEVIHTDILAQGITEPIGHADFYPNGGRDQPGCDSSSCSHARSYELFASSVRTNHFAGRHCLGLWQALLNSCTGRILNLGNGNLDKTGAGIYSVTTRNAWPF